MTTLRTLICYLLIDAVICQHLAASQKSRYPSALGATAMTENTQSASESVSESHSRVENKFSKQSSKHSSTRHTDIIKDSEMRNLQDISDWQNARNSNSRAGTGSMIASQRADRTGNVITSHIGTRGEVKGQPIDVPLTASLRPSDGNYGRTIIEGRVEGSPIVSTLNDISQGRLAVNDIVDLRQASRMKPSAEKESVMLSSFLATRHSESPRRNHLKTSVSSIQRGADELAELWKRKSANMLESSSSHSLSSSSSSSSSASSSSSSTSSSSSSKSNQSGRQDDGMSSRTHITPELPFVPDTMPSSSLKLSQNSRQNDGLFKGTNLSPERPLVPDTIPSSQTYNHNALMTDTTIDNVIREPSGSHANRISMTESGTIADELDAATLERLGIQESSVNTEINQFGNGIDHTVMTLQPQISNQAGNQKAIGHDSVQSSKTSMLIPLLEGGPMYPNTQTAVAQVGLTQSGSSMVTGGQTSDHSILQSGSTQSGSSNLMENQNSGLNILQNGLTQSVLPKVIKPQHSGLNILQNGLTGSSVVMESQKFGIARPHDGLADLGSSIVLDSQKPRIIMPQTGLRQSGSLMVLGDQRPAVIPQTDLTQSATSMIIQNQKPGIIMSQTGLRQSGASMVLPGQNAGQMFNAADMKRVLSSISQQSNNAAISDNQAANMKEVLSSIRQHSNSAAISGRPTPTSNGTNTYSFWYKTSSGTPGLVKVERSRFSSRSGIGQGDGLGSQFGNTGSSQSSNSWSSSWSTLPSSGQQGNVKDLQNRMASGQQGSVKDLKNKMASGSQGNIKNLQNMVASGSQGNTKTLQSKMSLGQILSKAGQAGNGAGKSGSSSSWRIQSSGTPSYSWSWSSKHGSASPSGLKGTGHGTNTAKQGSSSWSWSTGHGSNLPNGIKTAGQGMNTANSGASGSFRSWRQKSVSGTPDIGHVLKSISPPLAQSKISAGGTQAQAHTSESMVMGSSSSSSSSHKSQSHGQGQMFSSGSDMSGGCCT